VSEALRLLATQSRFDVVLSDVAMPGGEDGLSLARRLRSERPELPVVLISGYVATETAAREFVVLRKPCTQHELLAALHQAMHGRRASRTDALPNTLPAS
jgi:CheY-like chemotaxis protein